MKRAEEYTERHTRLQEILQKYGNEEYGDCILDEICELFGDELTPSDEEEETIPITYAQIKRTVGWSRYCDVTGANHYAIKEWGDYPDREIFDVKLSHAEELGLI